MFNGPRAGINVNDGFGGGNQIEKNLLFNFVRGNTYFTFMWMTLKKNFTCVICKIIIFNFFH